METLGDNRQGLQIRQETELLPFVDTTVRRKYVHYFHEGR